MSLPTVTQITKELIEQGIVKETGVLQSTGGRRAKALSAAADFRVAAGLDITRNHIGLILIKLAGEVLKYDRIPQVYENSEKYYHEVNRKLEEFLDKCGAVRSDFQPGELEQGSDFRCGEVGHMTIVPDGLPCYCGKKGCMDAYCSAKGLSVLTDDRLESFFSRLHQGDRDIECELSPAL